MTSGLSYVIRGKIGEVLEIDVPKRGAVGEVPQGEGKHWYDEKTYEKKESMYWGKQWEMGVL